MKEIKISIPSSTEFVGPVVRFFDTLFADSGISTLLSANIVTSIIEAVGNAITHGNKGELGKKVAIFIQLNKEKIIIEVTDEGEGVELASLPDPLAPENILKPCGRGIFLIKSLMDEVEFNCNGKGAKIIMKKKLDYHLE